MRRDWWAGIAWAVILLIYRMPSPQHHWRPLAGGRAGGVAAHPPGQNPPHPSGGTPPPRGNCNWQPVSVCSGGGHASRNKGGEEGNLNHHSPPPDSDRGGLLLKMFSWRKVESDGGRWKLFGSSRNKNIRRLTVENKHCSANSKMSLFVRGLRTCALLLMMASPFSACGALFEATHSPGRAWQAPCKPVASCWQAASFSWQATF